MPTVLPSRPSSTIDCQELCARQRAAAQEECAIAEQNFRYAHDPSSRIDRCSFTPATTLPSAITADRVPLAPAYADAGVLSSSSLLSRWGAPLSDGGVDYEDGTPATATQMAKDVCSKTAQRPVATQSASSGLLSAAKAAELASRVEAAKGRGRGCRTRGIWG